jgi:hypothetical protein
MPANSRRNNNLATFNRLCALKVKKINLIFWWHSCYLSYLNVSKSDEGWAARYMKLVRWYWTEYDAHIPSVSVVEAYQVLPYNPT